MALTWEVFGAQRASIVFGWIFAAHQLGAATVAYAAGAARTWFGNYQLAFMTTGVLCLLASGIVVRIGRLPGTPPAGRQSAWGWRTGCVVRGAIHNRARRRGRGGVTRGVVVGMTLLLVRHGCVGRCPRGAERFLPGRGRGPGPAARSSSSGSQGQSRSRMTASRYAPRQADCHLWATPQ